MPIYGSFIAVTSVESFRAHVLGRYVKQEMDDYALTACLVAWGTNMGIGRMAGISDIGYQVLSTTSDNFIRLETLRGANFMFVA